MTSEHWTALTTLFGPKGACAGCWCMFMRLPAADFLRGKGVGNRRALRRLVASRPPGLIAYDGEEAVAWVSVAPREEFARFETSRVLAPVAGKSVWSAPCFFVKASHRGVGLSAVLIEAAARFATRQGARSLEGYPNANRLERQPAAFVWTGFESTFKRAGFREVARRSPTRPIMRRELTRRPAGRTATKQAREGARRG